MEWAHRQRSNAGTQGYVAANAAVRRRGEPSLAAAGGREGGRKSAGPRKKEAPAGRNRHLHNAATRNAETIDRVVDSLKLPLLKPKCVLASHTDHGKKQMSLLRKKYNGDDAKLIGDLLAGTVSHHITDPVSRDQRAPTPAEQLWMLMTWIVTRRNNRAAAKTRNKK